MAYSKTPWASNTPISIANLQKIESQYTLFLANLATHVTTGHPATYYTEALMDSYFWHADNDGDGSTLNVDTLSGEHAAAIAGGIPSGFMGWWNPENGAVPASWLFCNGSNGTYDMRNRFPVGASGTLAAGSAVGNSQVTPEGTITVGACTLTTENIHHTHNIYDYFLATIGTVYTNGDSSGYMCYTVSYAAATTSATGGGGSHDHPGTFTGNAASLDPLFQYLVIIQRS